MVPQIVHVVHQDFTVSWPGSSFDQPFGYLKTWIVAYAGNCVACEHSKHHAAGGQGVDDED